MRKAVSSDYNLFAQAAGKDVHWRVSMKQTADITELQSVGTWIDVTDHLDINTPDKIIEKIELSFGQFTAVSLSFTGYDIAWWKANIFNVAADDYYIEMKMEFWLNNLTADTLTLFGGWVDWKKDQFCVKYTESKDSAGFTVFGYQEMGERVSATSTLFQPADDGGRLILLNIPGIVVSNANVTDYILKKGYHTLTYQFVESVTQIKLDNGEFVPTPETDGTITLVNEDGTQKIDLFIDVSQLTYGTADLTQDIVVLNEGMTIPYVWIQRTWVFTILKKLWAKMGIIDWFFDDSQIKTYDSRWTTSYYDVPPEDFIYQKPRCLKYDVTNNSIWIGVGDKIYKRSMTDHTYTYIGQAGSGYNIVRFFTEQLASNLIWGLAKNASYSYKVFRIVPTTGIVTSWSLTNRGTGDSSVTGCLNFAFASNYGAAGVVFYCSASGNQKVFYFDLNTLTEVDATYYTGHTPEYGLAGWSDGTHYFYQETAGTGTVRLCKLEDVGGGSWLATELLSGATTDQIEDGAFNIEEAKYIYSKIGGNGVYCYNHSADTLSTINASDGSGNFEYTTGKVYLTRFYPPDPPKMAYVDSNVLTEYPEAVVYPFAADGIAYPCGATYDTTINRYLGLFASSWKLFQFSQKIAMYIDREANYADMTVIDAIKELCNGFNLRFHITSIKKAYAFRRIDDSGALITSGNSITLNADKAKDISEETGYNEAYDIVSVNNGDAKESYDGTNFGALGMLGEKTNTINNRFIPTRLLKDYTVWFYNYYKDTHKRFMVPTPLIPFFQYGPYDEAILSFTGKIITSNTGIIIGQSMDRNGETEFEVAV